MAPLPGGVLNRSPHSRRFPSPAPYKGSNSTHHYHYKNSLLVNNSIRTSSSSVSGVPEHGNGHSDKKKNRSNKIGESVAGDSRREGAPSPSPSPSGVPTAPAFHGVPSTPGGLGGPGPGAGAPATRRGGKQASSLKRQASLIRQQATGAPARSTSSSHASSSSATAAAAAATSNNTSKISVLLDRAIASDAHTQATTALDTLKKVAQVCERHAHVRQAIKNDARVELFYTAVLDNASDADAVATSNALKAMGVLRPTNVKGLDESGILERARTLAPQMEPHQVAACAWGIASLVGSSTNAPQPRSCLAALLQRGADPAVANALGDAALGQILWAAVKMLPPTTNADGGGTTDDGYNADVDDVDGDHLAILAEQIPERASRMSAKRSTALLKCVALLGRRGWLPTTTAVNAVEHLLLQMTASKLPLAPKLYAEALRAAATLGGSDLTPRGRGATLVLSIRLIDAHRAQGAMWQPAVAESALWSLANLKLRPPSSTGPAAIVPLAEGESEGMLWLRYRECVGTISQAACDVSALSAYTSLQCSNVAWSCATLRSHPGDEGLRVLGQRLGERADGLGANALASALWGLAHLDWEPVPGVLEALVTRAGELGRLAGSRGGIKIASKLSLACWATGMVSYGRPVAVEASRVAMPTVSIALAEMLRKELASPSLLESAQRCAAVRRCAADFLWGIARIDYVPHPADRRVLEEALCVLPERGPSSWSSKNPAMLSTMDGGSGSSSISSITDGKSKLSTQGVVQSDGSILFTEQEQQDAGDDVEEARRTLIFPREAEFRVSDAANALWAVAHLRHLEGGVDGEHDIRVVGRLVRYAACAARDMTPLDVTSVLWALKALGLGVQTKAAEKIGSPLERLRAGLEARCLELALANDFGHAATRSARHSLAELGWAGEEAFGTLPLPRRAFASNASDGSSGGADDEFDDKESEDFGWSSPSSVSSNSLDRLLEALKSGDEFEYDG
ncbi:hypothetical protein PPROV_001084600 [Pycnococcus provasolii]|uniref:RAP domain-containing protein n=1 Tax=Pycnococcus provasolii TaxID=41880 RepID=A0A830I506_9CHLO|nr:hypothetical protein PPROV_001084600 [Pycnococcus provasolii]